MFFTFVLLEIKAYCIYCSAVSFFLNFCLNLESVLLVIIDSSQYFECKLFIVLICEKYMQLLEVIKSKYINILRTKDTLQNHPRINVLGTVMITMHHLNN